LISLSPKKRHPLRPAAGRPGRQKISRRQRWAAELLAKAVGQAVYRIDLSMIISKYIGETEKNLNKVFDAAARNNWMLLFDEADALFGKGSRDAYDRDTNQQLACF
jgi:ATP-dependent Clp protease ATP-binding subunit ClpA